jgi:molybdenum transport protein
MHRLGLSETVLIFAQHLVFVDRDVPLARCVRDLRRAHPGKKIAIEADRLDEALRYVDAGADLVQVDKFSADAVAAVVRHAGSGRGGTLVAAAGGIDADNAAQYAATGCAALVTSWPYWGRPADVHVTMDAPPR